MVPADYQQGIAMNRLRLLSYGSLSAPVSLPLSSEPRPSRWEDVRSREKRERASLVSLLPPRAGVSETPSRRQYEEPIVLWRMRRADGLLSHAVIGPRADRAVVVWFVNDCPLGFRDFGDWTSALRWSDQLQAQNWAVGWRLAPE